MTIGAGIALGAMWVSIAAIAHIRRNDISAFGIVLIVFIAAAATATAAG